MVVAGTPSKPTGLANGDHGIEGNETTGKWFPGFPRCGSEIVTVNTLMRSFKEHGSESLELFLRVLLFLLDVFKSSALCHVTSPTTERMN